MGKCKKARRQKEKIMDYHNTERLIIKVNHAALFQRFAQTRMTTFFGMQLSERSLPGFPKRFDFVSTDAQIIGDAKYLTLVNGTDIPAAKFMEIAAHVWLLEKTTAQRRFLVFGNEQAVPELWLKKYGSLNSQVEFYFLGLSGSIKRLA
jgi:hypothetical protein